MSSMSTSLQGFPSLLDVNIKGKVGTAFLGMCPLCHTVIHQDMHLSILNSFSSERFKYELTMHLLKNYELIHFNIIHY